MIRNRCRRLSCPASVPRASVLFASTLLALSCGETTESFAETAGRSLVRTAAPDDTIRIETVLGIPSVGRGGRVPFFVDPIENALARDQWRTPSEGETTVSKAPPPQPAETDDEDEDSLKDPGQEAEASTVEWKTYEAGDEGYIEAAELRGGYAVGTVEVPEAGFYLLDGAGYRHVYVNGTPRIGDVYHRGFLRIPVELKAGLNEFIFKEGWGAIRAELYAPPAPVFLEEKDLTLPSVVVGERDATIYAGVVVSNASREWHKDLFVVSRNPHGEEFVSRVGSLPPSRTRKVAVGIVSPFPEGSPDLDRDSLPDSIRVQLTLRVGSSNESLGEMDLGLDVTQPNEKHFRSFVSHIDGSVQHYGVTPPLEPVDADTTYGLYLTLHGAGVPARQAHHYRQRDDAFIVSPTNRREFGFDWEDWGRLDALEVLGEVERIFPLDEKRRWLTGHSMGGHGTWNFGAHYPDDFGAIGPSAGWRDFWSYSSSAVVDDVDPTGVDEVLSRSANPSRTLLLEDNYRHSGVYILHGDADATVPVDQARFMRERLAKFHPNFVYYERPGAGHWWGDQCMDWPPLMQFLARNPLPDPAEVATVDFTTINPGISDRCFWVQVEAQDRWMAPSNVKGGRTLAPSDSASTDPDTLRISLTTENVTRLGIDIATLARELPQDRPSRALRVEVEADSQDVEFEVSNRLINRGSISGSRSSFAPPPILGGASGSSPDSESGNGSGPRSFSGSIAGHSRLHLKLDGASWQESNMAPVDEKGPHRAGPFKEAFRNRVLFVVGTGGTPARNELLLEKALFDAETFYYRGNGAIEVVLDSEFDVEREGGRNIVLYGNADNNRAWSEVLRDCPIVVREGAISIDGIGDARRTLDGEDLGCLFTYPRSGSTSSSVGVVAGTGHLGFQACRQLSYFVSGVGYPDWVVFGADYLDAGTEAVQAAGFFDTDWRVGADTAIR